MGRGILLLLAGSLGAQTLAVSPTTLGFSGAAGSAIAAKSVAINNTGSGTFTWTAAAGTTSGGDWLKLAATSGPQNTTLSVGVDTGGLAPGTYFGLVTITATGAARSPERVFVTLVLSTPTSVAGAASIVRTMVHHQISALTADPNNTNGEYPVLSANGSRIVFAQAPGAGVASNPNRIFVINADGSGLQQVDSYVPLCFCGSRVDISADGSRIASTDVVQIRVVNSDGSSPRTVYDSGEIDGFRLTPDGSKVIFKIRRDTTLRGSSPAVPLQRGLWVVNADGTGLRQITGPTPIGALLGLPAANIFPFSALGPSVAVSQDGSRITFGIEVLGASHRLLAVNLDGSGLRQLIDPARYVYHTALNLDGSKVAYQVEYTGGGYEVGVINFDGSGRKLLVATAGLQIPPGPTPRVDAFQLTADGSQLFMGHGVLVDTATGVSRHVSTTGGGFLSDPQHLIYNGMYRGTMNATATRFLHLVRTDSNAQLIVADLNPSILGGAPTLTNPVVNPAYAVIGATAGATVSARVSVPGTLISVGSATTLKGYEDINVGRGLLLLDNGTQGDVQANDGVFTNNALRANTVAQPGERAIRIKAENRGADGKRHATQVEVAPFMVLTAAPTGTAPRIDSLSPGSGVAGIAITINGSGFDAVAANNTVTIGGVAASVASATATSLRVTVPGTLATGLHFVIVSRGGLASNGVAFAVLPAVSFSPHPRSVTLGGNVSPTAATSSSFVQILSAGGTVNWSASVTLLSGSGWLSLASSTGTSTAETPGAIRLAVNTASLAAGVYQATISVTDTATRYSVAIPVTLGLRAAQGRIVTSQRAFVFAAQQGSTTPQSQTLYMGNAGTGSLAYAITDSAPWLAITPASGSLSNNPLAPTTVTVTANPGGLAAGVYQAAIYVAAAGASNTPAALAVTLHVRPATTPATGEVSPLGLLYVSGIGGAPSPPKTLSIHNSGSGTFSFTAASSVTWLNLSASSGTVGASPANITVTANPTGLSPGILRGKVTITFSYGGTQEVDVLMALSPDPVTPLGRGDGAALACTAGSMDLVATSVGTGMNVSVSFPRQLTVLVVDNCGTSVTNATVLASIDGVNLTLQSLGNGLYSGSWTPTKAVSNIPATFTGIHATFPTVRKTITLSASTAPGSAELPVLFVDGVVEGAAFTPRRPLAPGGIVSLFGTKLANQEAGATQLPLTRDLAGVRVRIGNQDAPLYYTNTGQINAQVPFETAELESVGIVVTVNGQITSPQTYPVAPAQPGIFLAGAGGAILDAQSRLITLSNPARANDILQIYATGLGEGEVAVETGAAAPAGQVKTQVEVTIGGIPAAIQYQGFAPGFVGLYQVNVVVPQGVPTGDAVPVVIRQNGVVSNPDNPATIWVR